MQLRKLILIGIILLLSTVALTPVRAGGTVGDGSASSCTEAALRNAVTGGGTVTFNCGSGEVVITLSKQLQITKTTTIDGANNNIVLSGGGKVRIIESSAYNTLTLKNLTLKAGVSKASGNDRGTGGAVNNLNGANLYVDNVKFLNNTSYSLSGHNYGGGAIYSHGGILEVKNSYFSGNKADKSSGGAISMTVGTTRIYNSVFANNTATAPGFGGAFFNDSTLPNDPVVVISNSTFDGNSTNGGQGGAVWVWFDPKYGGSRLDVGKSKFVNNRVYKDPNGGKRGPGIGAGLRMGNGTLNLANSWFANNIAQEDSGQGGGLWTGEDAKVNVTNTTFSANKARYGGGIMVVSRGAAKFTNVTIAHNIALGGGGLNASSHGPITLTNTLFAHNTATNNYNGHHQCGSTFGDGGGNIMYPAPKSSNDPRCSSNISYGNPQLGTFNTSNGTYALGSTSRAINRGVNGACPKQDQRGVARPQGDRCDTGAFELEGSVPAAFNLVSPDNNTSVNSGKPTFQWSASSGVDKYVLKVLRADGSLFFKQAGAPSSFGCDGGGTCSSNPALMKKPLKDGKRYTWKVVAKNIFGKKKAGPVSFIANTSTLTVLTPPAFTEATGGKFPTFTWAEVEGATKYRVVIRTMAGKLLYRAGYYRTAAICASGVCKVDLANLPNGGSSFKVRKNRVQWFIQARNATGRVNSQTQILKVRE